MIKKLFALLKTNPLAKKYIEPLIVSLIEIPFQFDNQSIGVFKDSLGNSHALYKNFRDKVIPGWKNVLKPQNITKIPTKAELKVSYIKSQKLIKELKQILKSFDFSFEGKSVLEIGCHNGLKTYLLALENCRSATGSDVNFYYDNYTGKGGFNIDHYLENIRRTTLHLFNNGQVKRINERVSFVNDDITNSQLSDDSFDLITSWETLEHIIELDSAFNHMYRILKPGGLVFHQYNPFFCFNGGHSLCTLDFPWGHCRLSSNDFLDYIKKYRPQEYHLASTYYINSINRLSLDDLKRLASGHGFELMALIPFVKKAHVGVYEHKFFEQTKLHYPSVQPLDLMSPVVWVVLKK